MLIHLSYFFLINEAIVIIKVINSSGLRLPQDGKKGDAKRWEQKKMVNRWRVGMLVEFRNRRGAHPLA